MPYESASQSTGVWDQAALVSGIEPGDRGEGDLSPPERDSPGHSKERIFGMVHA
jgi:hypothetical protein